MFVFGVLQLVQQEIGFLFVVGVYVEDQVIEGFVQGGGVGVWGDQWNVGFVDGWQCCQYCGCVGEVEQCEYFVVLDQLLGIGQGVFGFVVIIQVQQVYVVVMYVVMGIDLGEIVVCFFLEVVFDFGCWFGKGC